MTTSIPPTTSVHVQIRTLRRDIPRAAKRLERWRPALKRNEYRTRKLEIENAAIRLRLLIEHAGAR